MSSTLQTQHCIWICHLQTQHCKFNHWPQFRLTRCHLPELAYSWVNIYAKYEYDLRFCMRTEILWSSLMRNKKTHFKYLYHTKKFHRLMSSHVIKRWVQTLKATSGMINRFDVDLGPKPRSSDIPYLAEISCTYTKTLCPYASNDTQRRP